MLTEKEMAKGGKVQALTDLVNKLDNELAKVKTQLENTSGTLADDSKHVEEAKKAVKEVSPMTHNTRNRLTRIAHQIARDKTCIKLDRDFLILRNEDRLRRCDS